MFSRRPPELELLSSASTSASLPLDHGVDLDLIDEIISRARDATHLVQVLEHYDRVLKDNGIMPSDDNVIYKFIIQLGLIKARTWGDKWDIWQSTNGPQAAAYPLKPAFETTAAVQRTPNPLRARVPFLAAASSDLDDAYADESDVTETKSETRTRRASPRKAMQDGMRSIVGFTPDHSVLDDSDMYPPRARTSTPVQVQRRLSREPYHEALLRTPRTTPTPPTYSESEADTTYRSRYRRTGQSPLSPQFKEPLLVSAPIIRNEPGPLAQREMDRRADEFYRLGLLGRCWGVWFQSMDWINSTTEQIDMVRNTLLVRQMLAKWRAVHEFHLSRPGTADTHYAHRLQKEAIDRWLARLRDRRLVAMERRFVKAGERQDVTKAWTTWRTKFVKIRTARWESDMKDREARAVRRVDENRLKNAFDTWRDLTRERVADKHYEKITKRSTFAQWQFSAEHSRLLHERVTSWEDQRIKATLKQCFGLWRKKASLLRTEDLVIQRRDHRVAARVWSQWKLSTTRNQLARDFNHCRLLKGAMGRMKKSIWKAKRLAEDYSRGRDLVLVSKTFNTWTREERGRLLQRVIEKRRAREFLVAWRKRQGEVEQLNVKASGFIASTGVKTVHIAFSRWRDVLGRKRNSALKADLIFEARNKQATFEKWRNAVKRIADNKVTADKAHAFFALRLAFQTWQVAMTRERQKGFIEERQKKQLAAAFNQWQQRTIQSLEDKRKVEEFQAAHNKRLLSSVLSLWTERVIELKSRELDVAEQRDTWLVRSAFRRWNRARKRQADLQALVQSVVDIKREDSMRRAFTIWLFKTRRERSLQQRLEEVEADRRQRLLADAFYTWHEKKRERDLGKIEHEVSLRHEDMLMFAVFDTWVSKSKLLPAVQFDNQRLRKAIFPKWKHAAEHSKMLKSVAAEHDLRVLADGFAVWREAFRSRVAKRPLQRTRRRLAHETPRYDRYEPRTGVVSTPLRNALPIPAANATSTPIAPSRRTSLGRLPQTPASRSVYTPRSTSRSRTASPNRAREGRGDSPAQDNFGPAMSVASEPAYSRASRLRSELVQSRDRPGGRVVSDEAVGPAARPASAASASRDVQPVSELVRALRLGRG